MLKSKEPIPEQWQWIEDLIDEAHLPKLGLPVRWDSTKEKHTKIVFDPKNNTTIDITTLKVTKHKTSPVGFITATKAKYSMPGSETPASARVERYNEPCLHNMMIKGASNENLIPCIAHGDYVQVEALDSDHMQAKAQILFRQKELVQKMNDDPTFAEFLIKQSGMNKFFKKVEGEYYGTLFFYELYFNDIDNIWLICSACNTKKKDEETLDWLSKQWLYGEKFLDDMAYQTIKHPENTKILNKTENKEGLAKFAIKWFWQRHANYMSVSQKLLENVTVPLTILNKKVDRIIGENDQKMRAERLKVSLNVKIELTSTIANAPGLGMPIGHAESDHSSSDEEERMSPMKDSSGEKIPITPGMYKTASTEVAEEMPNIIKELFKTKLKEKHTEKESNKSKIKKEPI